MKRLLAALLAFTVLPFAALAQTSTVPAYISYQGKITDAAGVPVGNTAPVNRTVIFRIWDSATATASANRLYSEQQNVTVSAGEFSVLIGAGTPVTGETTNPYTTFSAVIFGGATRYLGVTIDDGDLNLTNDPESSPRQQMVSTAFALRAATAESVASGGITSAALANSAVDSAALAVNAVASTKIADGAIIADKLASGSVTAAKLGSAAVGTTALVDGSVTGAKLASGAIDATKLADGSISLAKLASNSVDSSKIIDGAVATADLANLAVDGTKLADGAVTTAKLAASAVDSTKLLDSAVTLAKHAPDSVDSSKIVDGSITLADLATPVRDVIPKARVIYNQAVSTTVDGSNWTLVPIDLGELGADEDGCRLQIIAAHKSTNGEMYTSNMFLWAEPPLLTDTFLTSAGAADRTSGRRRLAGSWNNSGSISSGSMLLPPSSTQLDKFIFSVSGNDWIRFYNYYPGSLRSGDTDRQNSAGIDQGPSITLTIASIVTGTNKLTITTTNPHAILQGNEPAPSLAPYTVNLSGITGSPSATGTFTVTATPSRYSFEISLPGATGSYSGGTVAYLPKYSLYRIWAAVHYNVSARLIVSDR